MNWLKKLFSNSDKKAKPVAIAFQEDAPPNLDDKHSESELPSPTQKELLSLISNSDKLIISKLESNTDKVIKTPILVNGETIDIAGNPLERVKIMEITGQQEVQAVHKYFEINDRPSGHLRTIGSYTFDFVGKDGAVIEIEYLGFGCIRIKNQFWGDPELVRHLDFLNWLNSIGISEPLESHHELLKSQKADKEEAERIKMASPTSLYKNGEIEDLEALLTHEIPDTQSRIRSLFQTLGSSRTPWTQYRLPEQRASQLLLRIETAELVSVLNLKELDEDTKEGVARFFQGWNFNRTRKGGIDLLPPDISEEINRRYAIQYPDKEEN